MSRHLLLVVALLAASVSGLAVPPAAPSSRRHFVKWASAAAGCAVLPHPAWATKASREAFAAAQQGENKGETPVKKSLGTSLEMPPAVTRLVDDDKLEWKVRPTVLGSSQWRLGAAVYAVDAAVAPLSMPPPPPPSPSLVAVAVAL